MVSENRRNGLVEEVSIVSGLIGVQMMMSVHVFFLHKFLALGLNPMFLVITGSSVSALFLLPFAVVLERKRWPARLSPSLMLQMLLIAVLGVTLFQPVMLLGIKSTSPAIATAMPNLAPGIIFITAACLRMEKFCIRCKYSRTKVLGTMLCLGGALAMSFLMSPPPLVPDTTTSQASPALLVSDQSFRVMAANWQWILGCFYLLAGVIFVSLTTVLQAAAMVKFPAPFSLCVVTSFTGSFITAALELIIKRGKLDPGSSNLSLTTIMAIVLLGGAASSFCVAFQTWCVRKKGPVMVSIFTPIQTVCSAVLSAVILRQIINLGSLAGMILMFVGLYFVLWAKKKEVCSMQDVDDVEKPLLR